VPELRGAFAASLTPLCEGGAALDESAFEPLVDFLVAGGMSGALALGTTGEGILLSTAERRLAAELFLAAAAGRLSVIVHCGAQTTADTTELSAHAALAGADGVAVIGPPYFALDEQALLEHFATAAAACAPLPFYLYEFAARSGYAVPLEVIARFEPYLLEGLDVFVGPEGLIQRGIARGAVGVVSGLAAAFPEVVAQAIADPSEEGTAIAGRLREEVQRFPFHAALKHVLARRGVPVRMDVRRPLRTLDGNERRALDAALEAFA
jgi:4-hydroxy-tetrahydrodipicolinate synthase